VLGAEEVRLARVVLPDRGIRGHLHSAHGVGLSWLPRDLEASVGVGMRVVHERLVDPRVRARAAMLSHRLVSHNPRHDHAFTVDVPPQRSESTNT
jgi:hypothetical protein